MNLFLTIKDKVVFKELLSCAYHDKMIELLLWFNDTFKYFPVITSAYREGDNGVHGTIPCRGIDFRVRGKMADCMAAEINKTWVYDFKRPEKVVAIHHNVYGEHLHLQVHDNTALRKRGVN